MPEAAVQLTVAVVVAMFVKLGAPGALGGGGSVEKNAELAGPLPAGLVAITRTVYVVPPVRPVRFALNAAPTLVHAPEFTL